MHKVYKKLNIVAYSLEQCNDIAVGVIWTLEEWSEFNNVQEKETSLQKGINMKKFSAMQNKYGAKCSITFASYLKGL